MPKPATHTLTSLSRSASPLSQTRNEWDQRWSHSRSLHQPQVRTSSQKHHSHGHRRSGRFLPGVKSGIIRIGVSGDSDSGPKAEAILCGAEDGRHGRAAEESSGGGGGGGGSGIVVVVDSAGTWHSIIIMESATTATLRSALPLPCFALPSFAWPLSLSPSFASRTGLTRADSHTSVSHSDNVDTPRGKTAKLSASQLEGTELLMYLGLSRISHTHTHTHTRSKICQGHENRFECAPLGRY